MAENRIGRRFWKTHCLTDYVDKNNNIHENEEVEVDGRLTMQRAHGKVCRKLGTKNVIIKDEVWYSSFFASMSNEKFIENADIISD